MTLDPLGQHLAGGTGANCTGTRGGHGVGKVTEQDAWPSGPWGAAGVVSRHVEVCL